MCIYFVRDDNNAARAISIMLTADAGGKDDEKSYGVANPAFQFIRCQNPVRCLNVALVVR